MKATKYFALVAALLAVGCTNELMDDTINQNNNVEDGIVLTLTGDAQAEEAESRIIVDGSKSNGKYIVKWRNDDAVGIFSADGTTINNVKAAETTVDSGKTAATASFATESAVAANTGDEIVVYYPHNAGTTYANGKFSANLAASQQTNDLSVAYGFASYTFAYDVATVDAEGSIKFALEHPLAYVKVQVEVTDYVKNWKVRGVQIVDRTGAAKLAGDYTIDTATGELTVTNGTPSVEQYFKSAPTGTVEATSTRYMTLATLPWDFTGSEVWVVAKFEDDKGNTIYVPTKYENAKLKGGAWNIIKLTLNEGEHSAKGWYEPIDTRLMPGLGYAYGDQNTYLIQCKNGSTYTGATYTPNADIPSSVKVDIRGRGDFSKVVDVTKATFAWFKKGNQTTIPGQGANAVYVARTSGYTASAVDPTKYTIDDSTKEQGFITVKNTGAYAGAPILLMIVDNKVVWSWSFWNIAADGTTLEGVDVGNGTKLANMVIGQPTTNYATWGKNKNGSNPDPIYRFIHYYQWGRTMPHFWTSWWSVDPGDGTGNSNELPIIKSANPLTLAESIARPVGAITSTTEGVALSNWCKDDHTQLWGANGVKSVYDPCPKGWRVPEQDVYKYMKEHGTISYYDDTVTDYYGAPGAIYNSTPNILLVSGGYLNGYINTSSHRFQNQGAANTALNASGSTYGGAWTCSIYNENKNPIRLATGTNGRKQFETSSNANTISANVRCQKDTDNR